jgi:hypothetical protein
MSKKSRKRNKKILAALALAGGAALMARRGKGVAQGVSGANKAAFTSDAAYKLPAKNWISKKPVLPKYDQKEVPGDLYNEWDTIIKAPEVRRPPRGIIRPGNYTPASVGGHGVMFKKGGRVTGIAKRGFGRALMKGKK